MNNVSPTPVSQCAAAISGRLVVFLLGLLLLSGSARAAVVRWDGGGGTTAWTNPLNWSGNAVPTALDDVVLDNQFVLGSYAVVLTGLGQQARSLKVGYSGSSTFITLTIVGGGNGDNLRLGGAVGADLVVADGGTLVNQSTASGLNNRGLEFLNAADAWQMTGTGTYVHQQGGGVFLNVVPANVSFASTSTFEVRSGFTTTWGGATGGLSIIKRYGNLKLNSTTNVSQTITLRTATDSLLVTGDLTMFNSLCQLHISNNGTFVRAHVLGNVLMTDAQLYVSSGTSGSMLVVDGNVESVGATARVGAATAQGNPQGSLLIGGDLAAFYEGESNNETLIFWKPGATNVSQFSPVAGSDFKAVEVRKPIAINADFTFSNASNRLTIYSGGDFDTNNHVVGGTGKFELFAGGILRITSPAGITDGNTLAGNVQTTGSRDYDVGGRYWYTGSANQVTGDGLPASVRELRAATPATTTLVTLTNSVTVTSTLTLLSGRFYLVNRNLTMLPAAVLVGGSSSSYVRTFSSGTTTGVMVRRVPATAVGVLFPVGTTTYTPATLAQPAGATADYFRVRVFNGALTQGITGPAYVVNVVNRTWMVSEDLVGGSNASLTLQWNSAEEKLPFQRQSTRIRHYTGGAYDMVMPSAAAAGTDPYSLTRTGLTSFSPFIVGDAEVPLPVELMSFRAQAENGGALLTWTTASERINDRFEVQRSGSGAPDDFRTVGVVTGHGTTQQLHEYQWCDERLSGAAHLYYRLRQVDADGHITLSGVQVVKLSSSPLKVTAYPNPATTRLYVEVTGASAGVVVEITDGLGRLVRQTTTTNDALNLDVASLRTGHYVLVVRIPDGQQKRISLVKAD